eukprot:Sspe_Gene.87692::Locus_59379_Transcript_1_1_Confidence_1.000_Length_4092::g.87692::m.87692
MAEEIQKGDRVTLSGAVDGGCLRPGEIGEVIIVIAKDVKPYFVRGPTLAMHWYSRDEIQIAKNAALSTRAERMGEQTTSLKPRPSLYADSETDTGSSVSSSDEGDEESDEEENLLNQRLQRIREDMKQQGKPVEVRLKEAEDSEERERKSLEIQEKDKWGTLASTARRGLSAARERLEERREAQRKELDEKVRKANEAKEAKQRELDQLVREEKQRQEEARKEEAERDATQKQQEEARERERAEEAKREEERRQQQVVQRGQLLRLQELRNLPDEPGKPAVADGESPQQTPPTETPVVQPMTEEEIEHSKKTPVRDSLVVLAPGEPASDVLRPGEVGQVLAQVAGAKPYMVRGPRMNTAWFNSEQLVMAPLRAKFVINRKEYMERKAVESAAQQTPKTEALPPSTPSVAADRFRQGVIKAVDTPTEGSIEGTPTRTRRLSSAIAAQRLSDTARLATAQRKDEEIKAAAVEHMQEIKDHREKVVAACIRLKEIEAELAGASGAKTSDLRAEQGVLLTEVSAAQDKEDEIGKKWEDRAKVHQMSEEEKNVWLQYKIGMVSEVEEQERRQALDARRNSIQMRRLIEVQLEAAARSKMQAIEEFRRSRAAEERQIRAKIASYEKEIAQLETEKVSSGDKKIRLIVLRNSLLPEAQAELEERLKYWEENIPRMSPAEERAWRGLEAKKLARKQMQDDAADLSMRVLEAKKRYAQMQRKGGTDNKHVKAVVRAKTEFNKHATKHMTLSRRLLKGEKKAVEYAVEECTRVLELIQDADDRIGVLVLRADLGSIAAELEREEEHLEQTFNFDMEICELDMEERSIARNLKALATVKSADNRQADHFRQLLQDASVGMARQLESGKTGKAAKPAQKSKKKAEREPEPTRPVVTLPKGVAAPPFVRKLKESLVHLFEYGPPFSAPLRETEEDRCGDDVLFYTWETHHGNAWDMVTDALAKAREAEQRFLDVASVPYIALTGAMMWRMAQVKLRPELAAVKPLAVPEWLLSIITTAATPVAGLAVAVLAALSIKRPPKQRNLSVHVDDQALMLSPGSSLLQMQKQHSSPRHSFNFRRMSSAVSSPRAASIRGEDITIEDVEEVEEPEGEVEVITIVPEDIKTSTRDARIRKLLEEIRGGQSEEAWDWEWATVRRRCKAAYHLSPSQPNSHQIRTLDGWWTNRVPRRKCKRRKINKTKAAAYVAMYEDPLGFRQMATPLIFSGFHKDSVPRPSVIPPPHLPTKYRDSIILPPRGVGEAPEDPFHSPPKVPPKKREKKREVNPGLNGLAARALRRARKHGTDKIVQKSFVARKRETLLTV